MTITTSKYFGGCISLLRVYADLHVHSKYSRATSARMDVDEISRFAPLKGLNLVGTGDFTHPLWLGELKQKLVKVPNTDLFRPVKTPRSSLRFMVTGEVATIFTFKGQTKKIHHLILTPSLEMAVQINEELASFGNLSANGRPILDLDAAGLVEKVLEVSAENVVIPAHVWTPWFGLFGDLSGFNCIRDCYQDMAKHIFAVETGLSSDPAMNWRLSALDEVTLISNSDAHSSWPWRIGREANVLNLKKLTYTSIVEAIKSKDPRAFPLTIETYPDYGKYHWSGHRNCNISFPFDVAKRFRGICPICRRKLTKGVEQRIDELADRIIDYKPKDVPGFIHLLPLSEVIQVVLGATHPGVQKVWKSYSSLISAFGNEYKVLLDASFDAIKHIVDPRIAKVIVNVRKENVTVTPGYDGVYGKIEIDETENQKKRCAKKVDIVGEGGKRQPSQKRIEDFI